MASGSFKTIKAPSESLYKVKGSKHLGFAYPIRKEEQVKELVDALRKEHFGARHHCYAYRLGADGSKFRANDDGEPSGTAGKPILGQLQSFEVTNILVVVVRYFGGTKLGTSGLIDAYKTAAKLALEEATIVVETVKCPLEIHFPYASMGAVMGIVKQFNLEMAEHSFETRCSILFHVPIDEASTIQMHFEEIDHVTIIEHSSDRNR